MNFPCFLRLIIVSLLIAVSGYYVQPFLDMSQTPPGSVFATGLLTGCIAGGLLAALCCARGASTKESPETSVIYAGNLPFSASEDDVRKLFSRYGKVLDVRLVRIGRSGRNKGYGFVEMDARSAAKAIRALNETEFGGRTLRINTARKKDEA